MKRNIVIIISFVICFIGSICNAQYSYIYRNDKNFNKIELENGCLLHHNINNGNDIVSMGDEIVPLSVLDSISFRPTDIPILRFTFPEHQDLEWVVDKETYISAVLDIDGCGYTEDAYGLQLSVKGRGNSTWGFEKKPMRMKFPKKTSICGFTKAKNYVLLANYLDQTHLKNALGLWLCRRLGLEFSNHTMPCHVYVNDKYNGLYLLTEKIGINKASVDIDEQTGVLLELSVEYDEKYKFKSSRYNLPVMIKDPDFDELYEADSSITPDERLEYWKKDFENAERLLLNGRGDEVFDLRSAVDYYFVMNFIKNGEMGWPKSVYIYKRNLGMEEKYFFGPVWDLDAAFNKYVVSSDDGLVVVSPNVETWTLSLLRTLRNMPEFMELYQARIKEFEETIYPEMMEWIKGYSYLIEPAAKMDGLKWNETVSLGWTWRKSSFDTKENTEELIDWLHERLKFIKEEGEVIKSSSLVDNVAVDNSVNNNLDSSGSNLSENNSLIVYTADGMATPIQILDGLEIELTADDLSINLDGSLYSCSISDVKKIEYNYSNINSGIYESQIINQIKITKNGINIVPINPGLLEIYDLKGNKINEEVIFKESYIGYDNLPKGFIIVKFNQTSVIKLCIN